MKKWKCAGITLSRFLECMKLTPVESAELQIDGQKGRLKRFPFGSREHNYALQQLSRFEAKLKHARANAELSGENT